MDKTGPVYATEEYSYCDDKRYIRIFLSPFSRYHFGLHLADFYDLFIRSSSVAAGKCHTSAFVFKEISNANFYDNIIQ